MREILERQIIIISSLYDAQIHHDVLILHGALVLYDAPAHSHVLGLRDVPRADGALRACDAQDVGVFPAHLNFQVS